MNGYPDPVQCVNDGLRELTVYCRCCAESGGAANYVKYGVCGIKHEVTFARFVEVGASVVVGLAVTCWSLPLTALATWR